MSQEIFDKKEAEAIANRAITSATNQKVGENNMNGKKRKFYVDMIVHSMNAVFAEKKNELNTFNNHYEQLSAEIEKNLIITLKTKWLSEKHEVTLWTRVTGKGNHHAHSKPLQAIANEGSPDFRKAVEDAISYCIANPMPMLLFSSQTVQIQQQIQDTGRELQVQQQLFQMRQQLNQVHYQLEQQREANRRLSGMFIPPQHQTAPQPAGQFFGQNPNTFWTQQPSAPVFTNPPHGWQHPAAQQPGQQQNPGMHPYPGMPYNRY